MNISHMNTTELVNNSFYNQTNFTNTLGSLPAPEYIKLQWLFALVMTLLMIGLPALMIIYSFCRQQDYCRTCTTLTLGIVSQAFALWFLLAFFLMMWYEIIRFNEYEMTKMLVTDKQFNPYRCCDIVNCICIEAWGVPTCSSLVAQKKEGTCGNGYECCYHTTYECHCHETCNKGHCTESCSTCTKCASSVSNERCEVKCGTCYTPTVSVKYNVTEPNNTYVEHSSFSKSCGRDQYSCAANYLNSFVDIGNTFYGFYNPYDTKKIDTTNLYSLTTMAVTLVPAGIYLILICIMFGFCYDCGCYWFTDLFGSCFTSVRNGAKEYFKRIKKTLTQPLLDKDTSNL